MARERVHATYHTTPSTGDGCPPPPLLRKNATQSNTFSEYESASRPARGGCVIFSLLVVAGLLACISSCGQISWLWPLVKAVEIAIALRIGFHGMTAVIKGAYCIVQCIAVILVFDYILEVHMLRTALTLPCHDRV